MLLIITNKSDLTSDFLALRLKERSIPFFRFNTEDFLTNIDIDIKITNEKVNYEIVYNDRIIKPQEIVGVYFRRPLLPELNDITFREQVKFAEREIEANLSGIWRLIDLDKWLNHPKNIYLASNKIEQLKIAKNINFNIPNTLISTDREKIKSFFKENKNIIAKAVKHGFYPFKDKVKVALTQEINKSIIEDMKSYAKVPMIFQNKLDKAYDVRITVVGNKVFPVALYSQDHSASKIDWRAWDLNDNFNLKHEKIILPDEIIQKCITITKAFNLNFSAIDMVYTKQKEYVFLEMNPNGQWAWIEEKVNYKIRDSVIDFLRSGKNENRK